MYIQKQERERHVKYDMITWIDALCYLLVPQNWKNEHPTKIKLLHAYIYKYVLPLVEYKQNK